MHSHPNSPSIAHRFPAVARAAALALAVTLCAGTAGAGTTRAGARADVPGTFAIDDQVSPGSPVGAGAALVLPSPAGDGWVTVASNSRVGSMGMNATSRSSGAPGGFQARASASWDDSFTIMGSAAQAGTVGAFSGGVWISGDLTVLDGTGRYFGVASVGAIIDMFTGTGYNGGRVFLQGGGQYWQGYETPPLLIGSEGFSLVFDQAPFTFGQPIAISVSMNIQASVNIIDAGATGRAEAFYGHTLYWGGLSAVHDATGRVLHASEFTALSDSSGLDYAQPVPEPVSAALLCMGLLAIVARCHWCSRPS